MVVLEVATSFLLAVQMLIQVHLVKLAHIYRNLEILMRIAQSLKMMCRYWIANYQKYNQFHHLQFARVPVMEMGMLNYMGTPSASPGEGSVIGSAAVELRA